MLTLLKAILLPPAIGCITNAQRYRKREACGVIATIPVVKFNVLRTYLFNSPAK